MATPGSVASQVIILTLYGVLIVLAVTRLIWREEQAWVLAQASVLAAGVFGFMAALGRPGGLETGFPWRVATVMRLVEDVTLTLLAVWYCYYISLTTHGVLGASTIVPKWLHAFYISVSIFYVLCALVAFAWLAVSGEVRADEFALLAMEVTSATVALVFCITSIRLHRFLGLVISTLAANEPEVVYNEAGAPFHTAATQGQLGDPLGAEDDDAKKSPLQGATRRRMSSVSVTTQDSKTVVVTVEHEGDPMSMLRQTQTKLVVHAIGSAVYCVASVSLLASRPGSFLDSKSSLEAYRQRGQTAEEYVWDYIRLMALYLLFMFTRPATVWFKWPKNMQAWSCRRVFSWCCCREADAESDWRESLVS